MSNFNRKIKRTKKQIMKLVYAQFGLPLNFTEENCIIEVTAYNPLYYKNPSDLINAYGLLFNDFKKYNEKLNKKCDFMEFLKDSVENNCYLSDSIKKLDFTIKDDHIYFKYDNDNLDYINMGEFYIDNYQINVCHSYTFIKNLISGDKYLYYGD